MAVSPLRLSGIGLLKGLAPEIVAQVASHMRLRTFARREAVIKKGEPGDALCFLLRGRLQVLDFTQDGREVGIHFIEEGDYFGELAIIDDLPRSAFVVALSPAEVGFLPREQARELIFGHSQVAQRVMQRLAQMVRAASAQRALLGLSNPMQRVCAQLVKLVVKEGPGSVPLIPAPPTHQEIAIMVNTSRETVTRVFQVLQAHGVLRREGDRWFVLDMPLLLKIAAGEFKPE